MKSLYIIEICAMALVVSACSDDSLYNQIEEMGKLAAEFKDIENAIHNIRAYDSARTQETTDASMEVDLEGEEERGRELFRWILSTDDMTTLKWDNAFEPFRGKFVSFEGVVKDVGVNNDKVYVMLEVGRIPDRIWNGTFDPVYICFILKSDLRSEAVAWDRGTRLCLRGKVWRHFPARFPEGCVELLCSEKVASGRLEKN